MAHRKDKYVEHVLVRYTPRQAIKDAVGFVARFFTWSNLKHGFRSVIGGFKDAEDLGKVQNTLAHFGKLLDGTEQIVLLAQLPFDGPCNRSSCSVSCQRDYLWKG